MFKYFKEMRELKKETLETKKQTIEYLNLLLSEFWLSVIESKKVNKNKIDILDVVSKLKDVDQKDILQALATIVHESNQNDGE